MTHLYLLLLRIRKKLLNNGLQSICTPAYIWKMLFDPDPTKPAQQVLKKCAAIRLNNFQVERVSDQKHYVVLRDDKHNFKQHIDSVILKINKGI